MGFFKRVLGICETQVPADPDSWQYRNGRVEMDLSRVPELSESGSAVRLEGRGLPERLLIVHGEDGQLHAFRNRCTHMKRRLDPLPGTSAIQCCSVSKSTFDYTGTKISGPAKGDLTAYPVEQKDQRLTVVLQGTA